MSLDFTINLGGNFTDALGKANGKLGETEKGAHKAAEGVKLFEGEVGKLSGSLGGLGINLSAVSEGGSIFTFDLAEGLKAVVELVEKVVEKFVELGKEIITTAGKTQDLDLALELNFGEEGRDRVKKIGEAFEAKTRFNAEEIEGLLLPLGQAGIKDTVLLGRLATAATDIAARGKNTLGEAEEATQAFKKIQLRGEVNPKVLERLFINEKDFYKELGAELGVSMETAKEMAKDGKVKGDQLLAVTLAQISKNEGTPGELGTASERSAKTLGATLKQLHDLPENIFRRIADSPGMHAVQGFLDNFVSVLKGPIGTDIIEKIGGAFETVFGDMSGPDGLERMKVVIGGIGERIQGLIQDFRDGWPSVKDGFSDLWEITKGIAGAMKDIVDAYRWLKGLGGKIGDESAEGLVRHATGLSARQDLGNGVGLRLDDRDRQAALERAGGDSTLDRAFGQGSFLHRALTSEEGLQQEALAQLGKEGALSGAAFADGFKGGILAGQPAAQDATAQLGQSTIDTMQSTLQSHSPSLVMMKFGGYASEGFALGLEGGRDRVGSAARESIAQTAMGGAGDISVGSVAAAGEGRSISIGDIVVNVTSGGGDAAAVGYEIAQQVRIELKKAIDEVGETLGATTTS